MRWVPLPVVLAPLRWTDATDIAACADCGEDVELGEPYVREPAPEHGPSAHVIAHAWCALKNGYAIKPWAKVAG